MPRDVSWKQEIVLAVGQEAQKKDIDGVKVRGVYAGVLAPDFEATTLDGKPFKLSELRGKIVLLDFWATWCAPCVAELPNIKKLHERHSADGLVVVSVSFDRDADTARKFAADKQMTWTQIWTEKPDKSPLADRYGVSAIPATFLVGPDGKVIDRDARVVEAGVGHVAVQRGAALGGNRLERVEKRFGRRGLRVAEGEVVDVFLAQLGLEPPAFLKHVANPGGSPHVRGDFLGDSVRHDLSLPARDPGGMSVPAVFTCATPTTIAPLTQSCHSGRATGPPAWACSARPRARSRARMTFSMSTTTACVRRGGRVSCSMDSFGPGPAPLLSWVRR